MVRRYGLIAVVVALLAFVAVVPFKVESPRIVRTDAWGYTTSVGDTLVGGTGISHTGGTAGVCKTYPLVYGGVKIDRAKAIRLIVTWTTWTAGDFYLAPVYASAQRDTGMTNYFDSGVFTTKGWNNNYSSLIGWINVPWPTITSGIYGKLVIDLANVPAQGYLFVRVLTRGTDLTFNATGMKIRAEVQR